MRAEHSLDASAEILVAGTGRFQVGVSLLEGWLFEGGKEDRLDGRGRGHVRAPGRTASRITVRRNRPEPLTWSRLFSGRWGAGLRRSTRCTTRRERKSNIARRLPGRCRGRRRLRGLGVRRNIGAWPAPAWP